MKYILLFIGFILSASTLSAQVVAYPAPDLYACDIDNDGIEIFDLTENNIFIFGTQNPGRLVLTYHISQSDADNGLNSIVDPFNFMSVVPVMTIYARLGDSLTGDYDTANFDLYVISIPNPVSPTPLIVGEDDGDGIANFDLNSKSSEISNGNPAFVVRYFESMEEAEVGVPEIPSPYQNIVPFLQTVYARVANEDSCFAIVPLDLVVQQFPLIIPPIDLVAVDGDGDGFAIFDLTVNENIMMEGLNRTDYTISYYELEADAENDANRINEPTAYQNIQNPQNIYVRVEVIDSGIYVLASFMIEANVLSVDTFGFKNLSVFPNPTSGIITIESAQLTSETSILLYDIQGRIVVSEKMVPQNGSFIIDISSLENGVYFVKISCLPAGTASGGNVAVRKILKGD